MNFVLSHVGIVCALGRTLSEICQQAQSGKSHLETVRIPNFQTPFGAVDRQVSDRMRCYDLLDDMVTQIEDGLSELKKKFSPERVGIVLGSSNTGIHEAQMHIHQWMTEGVCPDSFSFDEIQLGSPALYLQEITEFQGPVYTVSTACSSAAKAFRTARDLIQNDLCDAVLVGGVDSKCAFALNGFHSLEALSPDLCRPCSVNRNGINLGEGGALFIMQKGETGIALLGVGETSDAHHLTHPDPTGNGAKKAMELAIADAGLKTTDIDYINLHGTGTGANDSMECRAVGELFGDEVLCASTKPMTGHALGAAGAIEAGLSWLMIREGFIIPHIWDGCRDPELFPVRLADGTEKNRVKNVLSNSFAFGGSNVSIVLGECV